MYVELFISFVAVIIWSHAVDGFVADVCYNIFFMSSITTILFNANPLMRFDGYYILSDSLGISNLYTKGTRLFTNRLQSWFFGIPFTPNSCGAREQLIVAIYGTMAFFWKILISLSLIIGASVLFHGAGKALAVVGIIFFFGIPLWRSFQQLYGAHANQRPDPRRVATSSLLVAATLVVLFFVAQAPATRSAPAIVKFKDETPVRAESDGFVREILVADGQHVDPGQLLIVLSNPQLQLEIEQLQNDVTAARIQARVYQQNGELALFQAEKEKQLGILQQLGEKRAQADALKVVAPFEGFVFERQLDAKAGTFVKQGDTLLNIAEKQTKEIVVAVDQRDWDSLKGRQGNTMRVAMTSLPVFQATISHIDPRATDIPQHESLCADVGGPLAIRTGSRLGNGQQDDPDVRLLTPHFNVDLALSRPVSKRLKSGQRGRAFFDASRQSLGGYWFVSVEDWLRKKVEIATQSAAF
jgi:putative peptide zinc metalloprotease protein